MLKNCIAREEKTEKKRRRHGTLFRAFRGLPKNKALIKFLSEPGMRAISAEDGKLLHAGPDKEMPKVDAGIVLYD